jgi:CRP/FNR family transcriptional regulator
MMDGGRLDEIDWCRALAPIARRTLATRATIRRYHRGERIFRAGELPRNLWIVLGGRVRVMAEEGRRRHLVHDEGPGGTLGEVPLFAGGRYPATAMAASAVVELAAVPRDALETVLRTEPELAWRLLERLARRVRTLVERLDQRAQGSVRAQVAARLLERSRSSPGAVSLGATHRELAEEWGTVREVVARELGSLRREGLVATAGRGRYRVIRPQLLEILTR